MTYYTNQKRKSTGMTSTGSMQVIQTNKQCLLNNKIKHMSVSHLFFKSDLRHIAQPFNFPIDLPIARGAITTTRHVRVVGIVLALQQQVLRDRTIIGAWSRWLREYETQIKFKRQSWIKTKTKIQNLYKSTKKNTRKMHSPWQSTH